MTEDIDMTPEERTRLNETHAMTLRLHRAMFEAPEGGGRPLIDRLMFMVETLERGGWAGKWMLRLIMGAAALGVALTQLRGFIK